MLTDTSFSASIVSAVKTDAYNLIHRCLKATKQTLCCEVSLLMGAARQNRVQGHQPREEGSEQQTVRGIAGLDPKLYPNPAPHASLKLTLTRNL